MDGILPSSYGERERERERKRERGREDARALHTKKQTPLLYLYSFV
jgi:hypothetical protein